MNAIIKSILGGCAALLLSAAAIAAIDVNKASQAELETIKGIGTASSARILDERSKAPFKDWTDLIDRVRGIGMGNAARFSTEGLTVNGTAFAAGDARADARKPTARAAAADAKPAAAAARAR